MGRAHEVRAASMAKTAAIKSKLYSRFGKELYIAAKSGVPDPDMNLTLKRKIAEAKSNQVPADVIKRAIEKAKADPSKLIGVAAVGFETTVPAYALMLQQARKQGIGNIRLITALKTVLPALEWICENQNDVDGFICPGHVSVITGIHVYDELAAKYGKPFVVAGFEAEHILATVYRIVRQIETGESQSENLYRNAVRDDGNAKALAVIDEVFETGPAVWRGLGEIAGSGLYLRGEYAAYDGGSRGLSEDMELPAACRCGDVIVGRIDPDECPMFGKGCDPMAPYGPCMVSAEGSCGIWYRNKH